MVSIGSQDPVHSIFDYQGHALFESNSGCVVMFQDMPERGVPPWLAVIMRAQNKFMQIKTPNGIKAVHIYIRPTSAMQMCVTAGITNTSFEPTDGTSTDASQNFIGTISPGYSPVAQLDRALVSGTKGRGFESLRAYQTIMFLRSLLLREPDYGLSFE